MTERYHACVAASRLGVRVVGNSLYMIIRIFGPNDLLFSSVRFVIGPYFGAK